MYRTSMLQRCQLNELASYRPQASAWCQLKYLLGPALSVRTLVMLEAMIEVPDRLKYDHDFSGERLTTDASSEDLSVIAILDSPKCDVEQILEDINDQRNVSLGDVIVAKRDGSNESIKDARIIGYTGTAAQGANAAIQLARGQRIAFWDPSCIYEQGRLRKQLDIKADIVGSTIVGDDGLEVHDETPYGYTNFSLRPHIPFETMMVDRTVFERIGVFDPVLPVKYGYDLALRATGLVTDGKQFSMAQLLHPLASRAEVLLSEMARFGFYRRFVARDILMHHFSRNCAHVWVDLEHKQ